MSSEPNRRWVLNALDQYESRLLRYAQRLLGDGCGGSAGDESRDVVQFVFLRLCDRSPEEIGDRLAQWLYTVCRNRALDVLRVSGRVGRAVSTTEADGGHSPPYSRECDPAELVEQSDLHALLRRLIEQLPKGQREVIDLWSDGFSYVQISEITSQTEGHIRVLVHRGLKAIREHPQVRLIVEEEEELETVRNTREQVCKH